MKRYYYTILILLLLIAKISLAVEYDQVCISGNCKQGQGIFSITQIDQGLPANTLTYQGNFENSQAEGQGNYKIIDLKNNIDVRYQGFFTQSIMHGSGNLIIQTPKHLIHYEGIFVNGRPHGNGNLQMQIFNNNDKNLSECDSLDSAVNFNQGMLQFPQLSTACIEIITSLINQEVCIPYQNPCPMLKINTTSIANNFSSNAILQKAKTSLSALKKKYNRTTNINLPNLVSGQSYYWGKGPDQFGLQNTPELEVLGPHTFAVDQKGQLYVLDSINNNLKQFDKQSNYLDNQSIFSWSEDLIITPGGQILNLADQKITDLTINKRYNISQEIPTVQGYRQGLFLDDKNLYICKLQQCYQVGILNKRGFVTVLPIEKQAKFIMPGYPLTEGLWIRTEWKNSQEVSLLFLNNDSTIINTIPLKAPVPLGTVGFLAKDSQNNLYFELEYLLENKKVMYVIWKVSVEGKLLTVVEIPNDYFTTVYKKVILNDQGDIYQILTSKEGVDVLQWELN